MSFFEERLLDCIAYGATGGPVWRTRRVELKNGHVLRNADWSRPQYRYAANFQNIDEENHAAVISAFNVCQGGCHGFRWWDRLDYIAPAGTEIGETDGTIQALQLVKPYAFSTGEVSRPIRKPRESGFQLSVQGVPVSSTLNTTTGIVTFGPHPPGGIVTWTGEFDVPVYFELDEFPWSIDNRGEDGFIVTGGFSLVEDFTQ